MGRRLERLPDGGVSFCGCCCRCCCCVCLVRRREEVGVVTGCGPQRGHASGEGIEVKVTSKGGRKVKLMNECGQGASTIVGGRSCCDKGGDREGYLV